MHAETTIKTMDIKSTPQLESNNLPQNIFFSNLRIIIFSVKIVFFSKPFSHKWKVD